MMTFAFAAIVFVARGIVVFEIYAVEHKDLSPGQEEFEMFGMPGRHSVHLSPRWQSVWACVTTTKGS